jgi:hypothetical protein
MLCLGNENALRGAGRETPVIIYKSDRQVNFRFAMVVIHRE